MPSGSHLFTVALAKLDAESLNAGTPCLLSFVTIFVGLVTILVRTVGVVCRDPLIAQLELAFRIAGQQLNELPDGTSGRDLFTRRGTDCLISGEMKVAVTKHDDPRTIIVGQVDP